MCALCAGVQNDENYQLTKVNRNRRDGSPGTAHHYQFWLAAGTNCLACTRAWVARGPICIVAHAVIHDGQLSFGFCPRTRTRRTTRLGRRLQETVTGSPKISATRENPAIEKPYKTFLYSLPARSPQPQTPTSPPKPRNPKLRPLQKPHNTPAKTLRNPETLPSLDKPPF